MTAELTARYNSDCHCCPTQPHQAATRIQALGADRVIDYTLDDFTQREERYDLILFSESHRYVDTHDALTRCRELLAPGGKILVCGMFSQSGAPKT